MFDKAVGLEQSLLLRCMTALVMRIELGQLAVFVSLGNSCRGKQGLGAGLDAAVAACHTAIGPPAHGFPTRTLAQRTDFGGNLHLLGLSIDFAPQPRLRASANGDAAVYILWRLEEVCGWGRKTCFKFGLSRCYFRCPEFS